LEVVLEEAFKYYSLSIGHQNRIQGNVVLYTEVHQEQFLALFRGLESPLT
jgi:hypothetical protein